MCWGRSTASDRNFAVIDNILIPLIKIGIVFGALSGVVALMTLAERKVAAFIQVRLGPMRVGPHGILQPIADGIKLMLKEDILPARADPWIFTLAPIIALVPGVHRLCRDSVRSVISKCSERRSRCGSRTSTSACCMCCRSRRSASWGSSSAAGPRTASIPLMGALRSAAQMVSYEVALGFSIMGVLMISGSLSLVDIVEQAEGVRLVVRLSAAPRIHSVFRLRHRGNQPGAVRSA